MPGEGELGVRAGVRFGEVVDGLSLRRAKAGLGVLPVISQSSCAAPTTQRRYRNSRLKSLHPQSTRHVKNIGIMQLAWRCLYAEIIGCRVDEKEFDINRPLKRCLAMIHSRVTAYGEQWKKWFNKKQHTTKAKLVAKRHQNYKLIKVEQNADYELNKAIAAALEKVN